MNAKSETTKAECELETQEREEEAMRDQMFDRFDSLFDESRFRRCDQ